MILGELDLGYRLSWPGPTVGQQLGDALIMGRRAFKYSQGRAVEQHDVKLELQAWQAIGGQPALSPAATRLLLHQLEELANPDIPLYVRWARTNQSGVPSRDDPHDGWYILASVSPNFSDPFISVGSTEVSASLIRVAGPSPASLAVYFTAALLSSSYSATPATFIAYPVGSTAVPATSGTRAGGEGTIPFSTTPPNPAPFVRPASIDTLYTGQVHVYDTVNTGSYAVPTSGGTFVNANWVEVFGPDHAFQGDIVVTNGLLLLLYQAGSAPAPAVYLWNTSLGTPSWQLMGNVQYQDNAANAGTLREVNLEAVGLEQVQLRLRLSTSAGNYATLKQRVRRGRYDVDCEFWPETQNNTSQLGLNWSTASAYVTGFTDATSSTTFPSNLATTTVSGYSAAQGSASGSPILGWLYQNTPTTAQGRLSSSTVFGLGDTGGPSSGSFKLYGFFAVPYSGSVVLATARGIVAPLFTQFLVQVIASWVRG
jgi:hypothetical protein